MGEALKRRERERLRVIEEARRWASSLPWPSSAILVGSYARGDFNLWSDVDVIIVSSAFEGLRVMDRLRLLDPPPGYEAIPWTPRSSWRPSGGATPSPSRPRVLE
ncbi:MAG: nucleotidyltransferase domain-containing protein [Desulfurococcales archaeon]|nr:nucleotidyltransferase domain-containing protein [Desulfurococcales archaeon]